MKPTRSILAMLMTAGSAEAQKPASVAPPAMQAVAPGLATYTDDVLFGDVWRRPELAPRDRSLVTLSVLIATGKTAQLEGHLRRGLDNGVRPGEISGLVTHLAFYSGWPSAVSVLEVIERVFRARKIDLATLRTNDAPLPQPAAEAARAAMVDADIAPTAPKLAALTNTVLFDDLWRRSDLGPRDRSLVTIAALSAGGDADQLGFHIRRGLENGLSREQIGEAITHLAFYAGWPKSMAAVSVAKTVFAQDGQGAAIGENETGKAPAITIVPAGNKPARAPASRFTGAVTTDTAFTGTGGSRLSGARVTFQPGARSNWHSHPLGQLLIVTAGRGLVQEEGGIRREIRTGETVWTAPGVKHWHGAAPGSAMSHFAVSETVEGANVLWLEPVTDEQYGQRTTQ